MKRRLMGALVTSVALLAGYAYWPSSDGDRPLSGASRAREERSNAKPSAALRDTAPVRTVVVPQKQTPEQARLWNELTRASSEMRAALLDDKRFPELAECRRSVEPRCTRIVSEAVRVALGWPVKAGIIERLKADPTSFDARALRDLASDVLGSSTEPELRAPLLVMIDLVKTYQVENDISLDAAAYSQLDEVTATEKTLLLREYAEAPLSDVATVERVRGLASRIEEDPSVRVAALGALTALGSGADVATVLDSLRASGGLKELAPSELGRMLARCGASCESSLLSLASSKVSAERQAALEAIALSGERLPTEVAEAVYGRLPPEAERTADEQDRVRYLHARRIAAR